MRRRKDETINRHQEAELPFVVDIPIPRDELRYNPTRWRLRVGICTGGDADRFARTFAGLVARRER